MNNDNTNNNNENSTNSLINTENSNISINNSSNTKPNNKTNNNHSNNSNNNNECNKISNNKSSGSNNDNNNINHNQQHINRNNDNKNDNPNMQTNNDHQNHTNNNNQNNLLNHCSTPSPLKDNNKLVVSMLSKHHAPYNSLNHITSILSPNPQSSNLTFQPNLQQSLISLKPTITHYDGQVAVRPPSTPIQSSINTTTTNPQSIPLLIDQNPSDLVQNLFQPYVQFPNPINVSSNFSDSTNTLINSHPNYSSFSNQNPISLNPHLFTNPSLISPTSVRNLSINRIRPSSVNFINKSNRKRVKR
jgi:hypothetical protein